MWDLCLHSTFIITSMLLIITNEADIHPNPVIDILLERGVPYFRLNTDKLLTDYDITYNISNDNYGFEIKYKRVNLSITDKQISCVWERRPMEPMATYDPIENEYLRKVVLDEADGFVRFLRYALTYNRDILWIGHPINERLGGSKILQKLVARDVGLSIPNTLFSNDFKSLKPFENKTLAIKPIASYDIPTDGGSIVFYVQKVDCEKVVELGEAAFRNTINFIEQYVEKDYELRITVVDGKFFTAKIESQKLDTDKGAVDWRQGYDHALRFLPTETPAELKRPCLDFLNYFDLKFGCFDFIRTTDNKYIFLECNTNGQWLWLEDEGLVISPALAELFIDQINSKGCSDASAESDSTQI